MITERLISACRLAIILPILAFTFICEAQNSMPKRLKTFIDNCKLTSIVDFEIGLEIYSQITKADVTQFSDSAKFYYHELAAILNSPLVEYNHPDTLNSVDESIYHLLEAKSLCETKLGIHSFDYMDIMGCLGQTYIELEKYDDALAIYQEGIIKSLQKCSDKKLLGDLIMGVSECYERLGWFDEIPEHLWGTWENFWPKDEPLGVYAYWPLWKLENFYYRYGMYERALYVSQRIEEFIISREGNNSPELCQSLYMKGSILGEAKRNEEAIIEYNRAITIALQNDLQDSLILKQIYGNLLCCEASLDKFDECDRLLQDIQSYDNYSGHTPFLNSALFTLAELLREKCLFSKALDYNSRISREALSDTERDMIEWQAHNIRYNQQIIDSFPQLEMQFNILEKGSKEWFNIAYNLSVVFYLRKDNFMNQQILEILYDEMHSNPSNADCHWTLINLLSNSIEIEKYDNVVKYAKEDLDYINSISTDPDSYHYTAQNSIIVAKIKANRLDGIDKDLENIEQFCLALYGESSSEYAIYLHNRGRAYQLQNKLEDAKTTLLRSISLQNKVDGRPMENTYRYYTEVVQQLGEL